MKITRFDKFNEKVATVSDISEQYELQYPMAGNVVDDRVVMDKIPNTGSISASLYRYTILGGIREVPMDLFDASKVFYAANDIQRSKALSEQIAESNEIAPLIIVVDKEGPYILEGVHRLVALSYLNAKSFPALVVLDLESLEENPEQK